MLYKEIASLGYEMSEIKQNDIVPVSPGKHCGSVKECPGKFVADLSSFDDFFKKVDEALPIVKKKLTTPEKLNWKNSTVPQLEDNALYHMVAFIMTFEQQLRKNIADSKQKRNAFYRENTPLLSQAFDSNNAACVECATLAQYYLENKGFDVKMMSGIFIREQDIADYTPLSDHTFNILRSNNQLYVYDVAKNNMATAEITLAQEKQIEARKENHEKKDNLTMIETKSFFGSADSVCYYGFGRGSILNPNSWLSKNNTKNLLINSKQNQADL